MEDDTMVNVLNESPDTTTTTTLPLLSFKKGKKKKQQDDLLLAAMNAAEMQQTVIVSPVGPAAHTITHFALDLEGNDSNGVGCAQAATMMFSSVSPTTSGAKSGTANDSQRQDASPPMMHAQVMG